jgi:acetate kinase
MSANCEATRSARKYEKRPMTILLLNAGSSSLKCTLMRPADSTVMASGTADWSGKAANYEYTGRDKQKRTEKVAWRTYADAVRQFLADAIENQPTTKNDKHELVGVGHRIVHGGDFTSSIVVSPEVHERIRDLADLAPLHNPPSLETLDAAQAIVPGVPHVAVFDTAFHATMPQEAWNYPVPHQWTHEWGIRRYGFHGLSHAYCSRRAAAMLARPIEELRLVVCHLGHGCSAAAIQHGKSIDTTMGYTPLEGLMMGTRSGSIDPGALLCLEQRHGVTAAKLDHALNHESGLLGVSGVSADMRQVLSAADAGDNQAKLAIAIYAHRVRQAIGALAVTMGGVDAVIFTAGVGEHAWQIRQAICKRLECLGLQIDPHKNENCRADADISAAESRVNTLVIATQEHLTMLGEVCRVLGINTSQATHPGCGVPRR